MVRTDEFIDKNLCLRHITYEETTMPAAIFNTPEFAKKLQDADFTDK